MPLNAEQLEFGSECVKLYLTKLFFIINGENYSFAFVQDTSEEKLARYGNRIVRLSKVKRPTNGEQTEESDK